MAIVSVQCMHILHLLIKQIRKGVAIVSEQLVYQLYIHTHLLIQKTREGVAIVSVQCIKLHILIKQIWEGACGYCLSTMNAQSTN